MQDILEDELRKQGLIPEQYPCKEYLMYIELLSEWNKTYNLTGITKSEQMITRHIINSLSAFPYICLLYTSDAADE